MIGGGGGGEEVFTFSALSSGGRGVELVSDPHGHLVEISGCPIPWFSLRGAQKQDALPLLPLCQGGVEGLRGAGGRAGWGGTARGGLGEGSLPASRL